MKVSREDNFYYNSKVSNSSSSPRKGQKEEGWKEVVRKNVRLSSRVNEFYHEGGGLMVVMLLPDHAERQSQGPGTVMEESNYGANTNPVDPALVGGSRSDSPVSTRTPPLDHMKFIQPIGGERRKGSGRPGQPAMTAGSYSNAWRFNDSAGADIKAETQETALTLACCGGFLDVADFLLRSGAHIELGCSTPLMVDAQEGNLELVSFFLQAGAQTGTGDTALLYAYENGHTDVAEVLLECGAKLPRVPVQGLANIVPPSEPDSQVPIPSAIQEMEFFLND